MKITHLEWYFEHINVFQNMHINLDFHHMLMVLYPKLVCFVICMYQPMTQTTHAIQCLYHISCSTIHASHSTIFKWDSNFDSTTGWIRILTWIMQANNCVEIEKDIQLCEGLGHTNDGGSVVRSPLKSFSQSSWARLLSELSKPLLCNTK